MASSVEMSSNTNKTPAKVPSPSKIPSPGSSPAKSSSIISESMSLRNKILQYLADTFESGVIDDDDIAFIHLDKTSALVDELLKFVQDGSHSVTLKQYDEVVRELAAAKLKITQDATTVKALNNSSALLSKDLAAAQANLSAINKQKDVAIKAHEQDKAKLITELATLREVSTDLKKQISAAKTNKDAETASELAKLKASNSGSIGRLNDLLQAKNTDIKEERSKAKRYEQQVVALSVELNNSRSRLDQKLNGKKPVPATFAEAATAMGTSSVDLVNTAWRSLRSTSVSYLKNIADGEQDDAKNKLFWVNKALSASKHAVFRPYKVVLDGVYDDVVNLSYSSRKAFLPFIDAVLDSLSATGKPLTEVEMLEMLKKINPDKLILSKAKRKPGVKTLSDAMASSSKNKDASSSDSEPDIGVGFRKLNKSRKRPLRNIDPISLDPSDGESSKGEDIPEPSKGDGNSKSSGSYYQQAKSWFRSARTSMRSSLKKSLAKSSDRLKTYYGLVTGSFLQRCFAVPYSWWISFFP